MRTGEGSDTEDEIERIQAQRLKQNEKREENTSEEVKPAEVDPFSVDTEDEEDVMLRKVEKVNHELPKFFEHHVLYIDKDLPKDDIKQIEKYIHAYKGVLVEDLSDIVDIILADRNKDSFSLNEACPEAKIIDYNWIWECHNQQKLVPLDNFTIQC
ncbi:DNA repair protein XRCC1-like [Agrilus planipennis]|uniref:DNA repair protein XRCC1-like n=1 Tax=Agrilus planipennis TaxID=224129 RepID=A0A1W4X4Z7_AGRPL|nr:DNA repair protein XRCC1-like [Agrilus planipennis]